MLNLATEKAAFEPWWFTLHDAIGKTPAVRVLFAPIGRIALRAARRAAGEQCQGVDLPDDENASLPPELIEAAGDAMSESLLMSGIIDWEGVGDADGIKAPVTPDNLRLFLADPIRFERLDTAYVRPFVLRELEKNGLAASLPGTSGIAAHISAEPSVTLDATDAASQTRKVKLSKRRRAARTKPTNREQKQAQASGT
ncbi:hypothetical protein [Sphingobium sp. B2]|uniref:hypothetical protein n=1 Tax=Sphingobium sp. B2 TaxID=2583228 RepID=UPI00119C98F6|nr:hypothetical protein [Sphingobium sp. B2]